MTSARTISIDLTGSLRPMATQTLTFFFTDIEGSTALLQRLGKRTRRFSPPTMG